MSPISSHSELNEAVFHLLHRASQRADDIFSREAKAAKLTSRQYAVLRSIASSDSPSHTDLIAVTGIDRATIGSMIRRMADAGLLQQRRSRADARAYVVSLTEAGRRALKVAKPGARRTDDTLLAPLTSEQREVFVELLGIVAVGRHLQTGA